MKMKQQISRMVAGMLAVVMLLPLIPLGALPAYAAAPTDLFFSEYIEGSSYNKALEIYNGTGAAIDLAAGGYTVQIYSNGSTSASQTIPLEGTVAGGHVFVLAQERADPAIIAQADQTTGMGLYNGDDAVVLSKGSTVLDVIGQIGFQPDPEWGSDPTGTKDNTLRRKASVCMGDPDGSDAFDPTVEWDGFAQDNIEGLGTHTADCGATVQDPKINEFSASTTGADVEYVELFGAADADYTAYRILEIEGDSNSNPGAVDEVISAGSTDGDGFWLQNLSTDSLENGTITLLLVKDFAGTAGDDLDTDDDGAFDVTPWSAIVDSVAVNDGGTDDLTYGVPVLGQNYDGVSSYAPGGASRFPDGMDTDSATDWVRNDFDLAGIPDYTGTLGPGEALNTPGAPNEIYVAPPEGCGDPFTPIYEVQGSGSASPLVGDEVAIEGIVVGDFQNNAASDNGDLHGFYVQDPDGDGDGATSDGVFVYDSGNLDVSLGDRVRVRGNVSEYYGLTEVGSNQIWQCSSGNSIDPTDVSLPLTNPDALEPYEGMLVNFSQDLTISEYYDFDRYGEIVLSTGRQYQPTAIYEPGSPEAAQLAADNLLGRILLDDGRTSQNPDPAIHPNGGVFNLDNLFRGGDMVRNVTGVMDYRYDLYRVQPIQGAGYVPANPRPAQPDDVGGTLKVASFNVLNYFTTIDTGDWICGPAGDMECRGADTPEEFTRQRDKIIAALATLDADVVGLIEIENYPGDVPTADLVAGLNAFLNAETYSFIETGAIGTDAIRQALIYKPAAVSPLGDYAILDSSVDSRFLDDYNRPALTQTFQDTATGGIFTVAVNHLKSKGSDCNDVGDPDLGDGAGNCNLTRTAAAEALVDWLATDPTGSGDDDFMIIGDLNSYDKEDPIDAILAGGYTDLIAQFQGEYAYSYVFDGQLGYLDHGLASAGLLDEVTGTTVWHINADEPDLIDYDMSYKQDAQDLLYAPDPYRASDHDPVVIGLNVYDEVAPTLEVSVTPDSLWPANHKYVEVTATVVATDNLDPNPTVTLVSVTSNESDNDLGDGDTDDDIVIVDDFTFQLRAERSGTGDGRIYTITYQATDAWGNSTIATATVTVPKNQKKNK